MILAESGNDSFFYFALILGVTAVSLVLLRRAYRQRTSTLAQIKAQNQQTLTRLKAEKSVRLGLDDLVIQIEDLSRRINAQVDTKFAKLETLIHDADDRIKRMEGLLLEVAQARAKLTTWTNERGAERASAALRAAAREAASRHDEAVSGAGSAPEEPDDRGTETDESPATDSGAAGADHEEVRQPLRSRAGRRMLDDVDEPPAKAEEGRFERVYALADRDVPPIRIAKEVGMTLGEVELLLELRKLR